jgi:hypothetical protein
VQLLRRIEDVTIDLILVSERKTGKTGGTDGFIKQIGEGTHILVGIEDHMTVDILLERQGMGMAAELGLDYKIPGSVVGPESAT